MSISPSYTLQSVYDDALILYSKMAHQANDRPLYPDEMLLQSYTDDFRSLVLRVDEIIRSKPPENNHLFSVMLNIHNHLEAERNDFALTDSFMRLHEKHLPKEQTPERPRGLLISYEGPTGSVTSRVGRKSAHASSSSSSSSSSSRVRPRDDQDKALCSISFFQKFVPLLEQWDAAGGDPEPFWTGREAKIINTMALLNRIPEESLLLRSQIIDAHRNTVDCLTVQDHEIAIHTIADDYVVQEMQEHWIALTPKLNKDPMNNYMVLIGYLRTLTGKLGSVKNPSAKEILKQMIAKTSEDIKHEITQVRRKDRAISISISVFLLNLAPKENESNQAKIDLKFKDVDVASKLKIMEYLLNQKVWIDSSKMEQYVHSTPYSEWPGTYDQKLIALMAIHSDLSMNKRSQQMENVLNAILLEGEGVLKLVTSYLFPTSDSELNAAEIALHYLKREEQPLSSCIAPFDIGQSHELVGPSSSHLSGASSSSGPLRPSSSIDPSLTSFPIHRTALEIECAIRPSDKLFLRAHLPEKGITWDRGVELTRTPEGRYSFNVDVDEDFEFKVLVNDWNWSAGPNMTAKRNQAMRFQPTFENPI